VLGKKLTFQQLYAEDSGGLQSDVKLDRYRIWASDAQSYVADRWRTKNHQQIVNKKRRFDSQYSHSLAAHFLYICSFELNVVNLDRILFHSKIIQTEKADEPHLSDWEGSCVSFIPRAS
jgi:hypothetical protein